MHEGGRVPKANYLGLESQFLFDRLFGHRLLYLFVFLDIWASIIFAKYEWFIKQVQRFLLYLVIH